ncbi:MAG: hypothetical protein ABH823_02285 [bacterium]
MIKTMRRTIILVGIFLFSVDMSFAAGSWTAQLNSAVDPQFNAVYFVSESTGEAVGDGGHIYQTSNRGATWTAHRHSQLVTTDLNDVYFYTSGLGWAVGDDKVILKYAGSTDTWTQMTVTDDNNFDITSVHFVSDLVGWATPDLCKSGCLDNFVNILKTIDGGVNWTADTIRNTDESSLIANYFYDVYFVDANTGWLVGKSNENKAKIFGTVDAGLTWTDMGPADLSGVEFRGVYAADSSNVWVAGGNSTGNIGYIYHSSDGGATWSLQYTSASTFFRGITGAGEDYLWACDGTASVYQWNSADSTWEADATSPTSSFNDIFAYNNSNIWIAGGGGTRKIYKYVIEPSGLIATPGQLELGLSSSYPVTISITGNNIQDNSTFAFSGANAADITVNSQTINAADPTNLAINVNITVPSVASASFTGATSDYTFTVSNPDESTSADGTLTLGNPTSAPRVPEARGRSDATTRSLKSHQRSNFNFQVDTIDTSLFTSSGVRASSVDPSVNMELIIYHFGTGQVAYRRTFNAEPDGYTTVTLSTLTDLGVDVAEGVYHAIVVHPQYGKIGDGHIVVHYTE